MRGSGCFSAFFDGVWYNKKSECTRKKECTYTNIHIQKKECTYIQDNRIGQKGCSMALLDRLIEKAKQNPKRIVLSECDSERMLLAARTVLDSGIGFPVLVHDPAVINETAKTAGVDLTGMEIVDCTDPEAAETLVKEYYQEYYPGAIKKHRTEQEYREEIRDPMAYAMMLEAIGMADCSFQGHIHTTGDVLRSALHIIGLKEGIITASMSAFVETPGFDGPEGNVIVFADCALNTEPDADKLASIAIAAADDVRSILQWEPRVAFLSFSTDGSGSSASVEKMRAAVSLTHELRPDIKADGEFQLDAAINPETAAKKVKRPSEVAGKANILIFPNLDAANIGIKLCQRFAGSLGIGHTISGFRKPVADSSRSASVEEMVGDMALIILAC